MTTRFEFGFGEGEIFRQRMERQNEMFKQVMKENEDLPEEERRLLDYGSDYYGFRGAGRRLENDENMNDSERSRRRTR